MNDTTRNRAHAAGEVDEALQHVDVFTDEYASYDEDAARRRIARRVAAARRSRTKLSHQDDLGDTPAPSPSAPATPQERKLLLDAACNVRAARALDSLTRALIDSPEFTRLALQSDAWPHSQPSALLFASLLHLSGRTEPAQFWFQYAAGAGSTTAARALYLLHLSRAEIATAHHWQNQPSWPDSQEELPALPTNAENIEDTLDASIIWTAPPISTRKITPTPPVGPHLRRLPAPIRFALNITFSEEHEDLGEIHTPSPRLASCLARWARLDPDGLTSDAQPGARMAKRPTPKRPANSRLESAHRALHVLEVIHRHTGGVSRTQIARETGLPQLHLAQALDHLVRTQLATPIAQGVYASGSSLKLAEAGRPGSSLLRETLAFLRDEVGAAVYVARYTDGEVSITQYADGPSTPAVHEWVDFREAAHASAVGKALLAQLNEDKRRAHLERHRMDAFTPTPSPARKSSSPNSTPDTPASLSWTCRSTPSAPSAPQSPSLPDPNPSASHCPCPPLTRTGSGRPLTFCATKPLPCSWLCWSSAATPSRRRRLRQSARPYLEPDDPEQRPIERGGLFRLTGWRRPSPLRRVRSAQPGIGVDGHRIALVDGETVGDLVEVGPHLRVVDIGLAHSLVRGRGRGPEPADALVVGVHLGLYRRVGYRRASHHELRHTDHLRRHLTLPALRVLGGHRLDGLPGLLPRLRPPLPYLGLGLGGGWNPSNRFSGLLIFVIWPLSLPSSSSAMVRPTVRASVSSRSRSASSRWWCSRSTATWSSWLSRTPWISRSPRSSSRISRICCNRSRSASS